MSSPQPAGPSAQSEGAAGALHRFGRYEVIRPLGRGAMGVVYLAHDPQLERAVALKTVWWPDHRGVDEGARGELRARFLREARAAAQFVHPNIVTVFDVGEEAEVTFIAMEYVAGRTLAALLAEEGPPGSPRLVHPAGDTPRRPPQGACGSLEALVRAQWAARLAAQVADALAYAHAKGVVHRDIKPANLLVAADGTVKVADFGIARVANSTLTLEATVLGTPAYMAPEQIAGQPVDARADLFALGVVLFEMVAGRRPFEGSDLTALAYQVVHAPHPPLASLRPGLPRAFEQVCARALAKEPAARYATAAEMAADLWALADGRALAEVASGATLAGATRVDGRPQSAGTPGAGLSPEERAAALAAEAARTATRLGRDGGRLFERLLAELAAGCAVAVGLLGAVARRALAASRAMPAGRRALAVGGAGALLALWLVLSVTLDPVRPARRLLAEGKRGEAVSLLLKLEASDSDQVDARILLLEHADSCAVRKRVARRLGEIGDPDALPALEAVRRRGLLDNLCMGGTLDQAIHRLRGEESAGGSAPATTRRESGRLGDDRAGGQPVGQDPAADVKRVFEKIGEAFR